MQMTSCGIDFGTSNSSIAIAQDGNVSCVPVEGHHITTPSAMFYPADNTGSKYGRTALKSFLERKEGRLLRSLKRVLGTSVMKHGTIVNGKALRFERIIASFLQHLKAHSEAVANQQVDHVVVGRPVHFVDNNPEADTQAKRELELIARSIGFKHVEFQFEPIAAAFAHEVNVKGEKLAVVADIGGGTSDFTVIRLSDQYVRKSDRSMDILANSGVRVGGNDFDKDLSLAVFMPEIGYSTTYGPKKLEVPLKYFHDLAEWSKVNFLYTPKVLTQVRQFLHESHDRQRLLRLVKLLEKEMGHTLLAVAEDSKIELTEDNLHHATFEFLEPGFSMSVSRKKFEEIIQEDVHRITVAVNDCLRKANVRSEMIELVILTGGSTEIPIVQNAFADLFPKASVAGENKLSSVGLGLAYDSQNRFR